MNLRVVLTGAAMIALAAVFFFGMLVQLAPKSRDPAEMMQTVGMVSGAGAGIGIAMILYGLLRRKRG